MKMATFRQSTLRQSTHSCNRASYHESAGCITCGTQSTSLGNFMLGKKRESRFNWSTQTLRCTVHCEQPERGGLPAWQILGRCLRHLDHICENKTSRNITQVLGFGRIFWSIQWIFGHNKRYKFPDQLSNCYLLNHVSAVCVISIVEVLCSLILVQA
jgi:hypothetical protein